MKNVHDGDTLYRFPRFSKHNLRTSLRDSNVELLTSWFPDVKYRGNLSLVSGFWMLSI